MVDSAREDGAGTATNLAAGAARQGVRGYLTGGLIGAGVVGGTFVALGRSISKAADGVRGAKTGAFLKGLGALVTWGGGATGAVIGAGSGANLGGIVGALDGAGDGLDKAHRNKVAATEREQDIAQQQVNQLIAMQDKQLAMNAQNAYNEGIQAGMVAATQAAHAGFAAADQAPQVAEQEAVQLGAPGTFTARVHPQSALKVEMAPAQGSIKPESVAAAKEDAAAAIVTR